MFATKSQIALQLIEQALADQVAPAPVLGATPLTAIALLSANVYGNLIWSFFYK